MDFLHGGEKSTCCVVVMRRREGGREHRAELEVSVSQGARSHLYVLGRDELRVHRFVLRLCALQLHGKWNADCDVNNCK